MSARTVYVIRCDGGDGCANEFASRQRLVDNARLDAHRAGWTVVVKPASKEQRSPQSRSSDLCPSCSAVRAAKAVG